MKSYLTVVALFAAFVAAAPTPADTTDNNFTIKFNGTTAEDALKALGLAEDETSEPEAKEAEKTPLLPDLSAIFGSE